MSYSHNEQQVKPLVAGASTRQATQALVSTPNPKPPSTPAASLAAGSNTHCAAEEQSYVDEYNNLLAGPDQIKTADPSYYNQSAAHIYQLYVGDMQQVGCAPVLPAPTYVSGTVLATPSSTPDPSIVLMQCQETKQQDTANYNSAVSSEDLRYQDQANQIHNLEVQLQVDNANTGTGAQIVQNLTTQNNSEHLANVNTAQTRYQQELASLSC